METRGRISAQVARLRVELPLTLTAGGDVGELVAEARDLAIAGCTPLVRRVADWAEAVASAAGDTRGGARRAREALSELEASGEVLAANVLAVDALSHLSAEEAHAEAQMLVPRLEEIGAAGSADRARAFLDA